MTATSQDRFAQASEVFRRAWSTYDRVVASNVMRHVEMEAHLRQLLLQHSQPYSLLDLGCGDASMVARAIKGTSIVSYTGVELVEATTRLADENLRDAVSRRSFVIGDLMQAVRPGGEKYDVILASYSVHHLSLAEKGTFFRDVPGRLNPGGEFILIDLMRPAGEGREPFLQRMHAYADRSPIDISNEERADIRSHVDANDFPEEQSTLEELARSAGFTRIQRRYYDPEQFFSMLTFER